MIQNLRQIIVNYQNPDISISSSFTISFKELIQSMKSALWVSTQKQSFDKKKSNIVFFNDQINIFKVINYNELANTFFKERNFEKKKTHNFYIAPPFYFSVTASLTTAFLLLGMVQFFHKEEIFNYFKINFVVFLLTLFYWIFKLAKQGKYSLNFSSVAQNNLLTGIVLFIISEIIIFFGIFWSYLHSALSPSSEIGGVWPPYGLEVLEWWKWPTIGTFLLIYSGFSANVFFYALKSLNIKSYFNTGSNSISSFSYFETMTSNKNISTQGIFSLCNESEHTGTITSVNKFSNRFYKIWFTTFTALIHTLTFGFIFLICQKHEYAHATYSASDGIYGTVFYGITGLHGLHVFLGFVLLFIIFVRLLIGGFFETQPHVSVSGSVWYWHFVDIVWIFVYIVVYYWGSQNTTFSILFFNELYSNEIYKYLKKSE